MLTQAQLQSEYARGFMEKLAQQMPVAKVLSKLPMGVRPRNWEALLLMADKLRGRAPGTGAPLMARSMPESAAFSDAAAIKMPVKYLNFDYSADAEKLRQRPEYLQGIMDGLKTQPLARTKTLSPMLLSAAGKA